MIDLRDRNGARGEPVDASRMGHETNCPAHFEDTAPPPAVSSGEGEGATPPAPDAPPSPQSRVMMACSFRTVPDRSGDCGLCGERWEHPNHKQAHKTPVSWRHGEPTPGHVRSDRHPMGVPF